MLRRDFLTLAGAVPALADKHEIPVRHVKVETAFNSPCTRPNGLQATQEGLWILNQGGDNALYLTDWNGKLIEKLNTESVSGSGVTFDGRNLWIASTYNCKVLKVDRKSGKTLAAHETPGCGKVNWPNPRRSPLAPKEEPRPRPAAAAVRAPDERQNTGAHGMEYKNGKLWLAVPPSKTIYRINPDPFTVEFSFPSAGDRPHGVGWEGDHLWCADSNENAFHKHDVKTGKVLAKIQLADTDPLPHGMTVWKGVMWYCDDVGVVCRFKL